MELTKKNPGVVTVLKNLGHMPQAQIAEVFSSLGYLSKTGKTLTASHISSLERALGRRRVHPYEKNSSKRNG